MVNYLILSITYQKQKPKRLKISPEITKNELTKLKNYLPGTDYNLFDDPKKISSMKLWYILVYVFPDREIKTTDREKVEKWYNECKVEYFNRL